MDLSIFKAYDVRGVYPAQIDEDAVYKIGRAFACFLSAKKVVVGRDMRNSSPSLSQKLTDGLICEGVDVVDIGECTTPMLNFAVAHYGYDGGVMVTASHNPAQYNGLKLIGQGAEMLDQDSGLSDIKNLVKSEPNGNPKEAGAVTSKDILPDYIAHILSLTGTISGLKVAVDYGNGMGAVSAKPVLARLDLELIELNATPDGNFPQHEPNPEYFNNFGQLVSAVKAQKADIGLFFDGDADRAMFVDELGQPAPIDLLGILLAKHELLSKPGERVYYDLRFTKAFPVAVREAAGEPIMMRVGNPFYKTALKKEGGILGAELAGHVMFAENYCIDDGLLAALKLFTVLAKSKKPLSELIAEVKRFETSPEEASEAPHPETIKNRLVSAFPEGQLIEMDGVYLDLEDGFVSVRQSQTEPQLFRFRVEAKTKKEMQKRLKIVRDIVQS